MPTIFTRLYGSEAQAAAVVERLKAAKYYDSEISVISSPVMSAESGFQDGSQNTEDIASKLREANVYRTAARKYAEKMTPGTAVVVVCADIGRGRSVPRILDTVDSLDAGVLKEENFVEYDSGYYGVVKSSGRRSIIPRRAKPRTKPRRRVTPFLGIPTIIRAKGGKRRRSNSPITGGLLIRKRSKRRAVSGSPRP